MLLIDWWLLLLLSLAVAVATGTSSSPAYYDWMLLVSDRTNAGPPEPEDFRSVIESSGLQFLKAVPSTRHAVSLWFLSGTQQHWDAFSAHPASPLRITARYRSAVSNGGQKPIRTGASVTVTVSYAAGNWGLDRIDQRSLPLDGNYNPGAAETGAGANVYLFDTGATLDSDLGGRVIAEYTAYAGEPYDCNGHASHVSGIIAGTLYGVAKQATIHSYRVLDCTGSGTLSSLAEALLVANSAYVAPAVINLSLEYDGADAVISNLLQLFVSDNVPVAAAAGNEGTDGCDQPAATAGVMAVGATTINDVAASYSNYGSCIDIWAPGDSILSDWLNGSTAVLSGTSMATAFVTGANALLVANYPSATASQVTNGLLADATAGALSAIGTGSPNLLLYVVDLEPSSASSSPPPPPPPPPASGGGGGGDAAVVSLVYIFLVVCSLAMNFLLF